jgi:glycosyltransferase involved in cell wall biosynthesis
MTRLSVLTAFFNEAPNLPRLRERLEAVFERLDIEPEIILIDDHSTDGSAEIARDWARSDDRVLYIRLSRNCGSHAAYSAGLAQCSGECAVLLAADLQDPPETVPQLLAKWREGYHVVWAVREGRQGESRSTKFFSHLYYRLMRRLGLTDMPKSGADFLLVDRKVIDAYNEIPEKNTSFLAMILWLGFRQTSVGYIKQARLAGRSKWTFRKKVKLLADSVVSFSFAPIRLMSWLGFLLALCGFVYAGVVVLGWLAGYVVVGTGFAALMTVLLVGQGSILMSLGIIGEYLWRTFDEARGRPRYILEECFVGHRQTDGATAAQATAAGAAAARGGKSAQNLADGIDSRLNLKAAEQ